MRAAAAAREMKPETARSLSRRHQHLKDLMVQKVEALHAKSGMGKLSPEARRFVEQQIEQLLRGGKVQETDLVRVAVQLRSVGVDYSTVGSRVSRQRPAASSVAKEGDLARHYAEQQEYKDNRDRDGGGLSPSQRRMMEQANRDYWARMCLKDVEEWKQDLKKEKNKQRDLMEQQRRALDQQVAASQSIKKEQIAKEQAYAREEEKQRELWNEETRRQDEKRREAFQTEKRIRDEQLHELQRRRAEEEERKRKEDERIAQKLREELRVEQEEKLRVKEKAREEMKKSIEYNKAQNAVKERLIREEAEMDRMHQRLHLEKLEKQEREREGMLRKIYDRQSKQRNMAEAMQQSMAEKAAEDERKAQIEMEKKMQRIQEEEREREERTKKERQAMRRFLAQQIAEKETRRQREMRESSKEREALAHDLEVAEHLEAERRQARRERDIAHRRQIEQQIHEKRARQQEVMSETERKLNAAMLRKISVDPE